MSRTTVSNRPLIKDYVSCLNFGAVSTARLVPSNSIDPTNAVSIACWIKLNSLGPSNGGRIVDKKATANGYIFLCNPNGVLALILDAVTVSTPNATLQLKKWVHVAATFDKTLISNQISVYIDGVLMANGTKTTDIGSDGGTEYIGNRSDNGRNLDGKMDDFRFYTRCLSGSEIQSLYYGREPSTSGLVQYYKFDEGSGTSALDSSGNSNTGTITGATYSTDVVMGARSTAASRSLVKEFETSLNFTPSGSRVTVTDNAILRLTSALTISLWIKPNSFGSGGTARILSKIPSTAGYQVLFLNNSSQGAFRFAVFGGNYDSNNNSIILKQWQHLVVTFDKTLSSNQINFYINGTNVGSATRTTDIATDTSDLIIGDQPAGSKVFDGLMDDLRIYNRGLSSTEVANLYRNIEPSSTGLILYHKYDEIAGTTTIDSSGTGNSGTITNAIYSCDVPMSNRDLYHSDNPIIFQNGIWSWFSDPRAVRYNNSADQTYIGYVNSSGDVTVTSYNNSNGTKTNFVLHSALEVDDHDAPAVLIRADGKIQCFYSRHSADNNLYYRISSNAEDVSAFEAETTIGTNTAGANGLSYSNPFYLSSEGKYYLFWRGGDWLPAYSTSTDGTTWNTAANLITVGGGNRPYVKYASNNTDTIHFAFTDGHPDAMTASIYYCYYKGGNFYKANGTLIKSIGSLPLQTSEVDTVYNSANSWIWDVAIDSNNYPVIVYVSFTSTTNHRYRYARWNGSSWIDNEITGGGTYIYAAQPHYSSGICLDHDNPSIVYLTRKINSNYQLFKYVTSDNGITWRRESIKTASDSVVFRPASVWNHGTDSMQLVWFEGTYASYTSFSTNIKGLKRSY